MEVGKKYQHRKQDSTKPITLYTLEMMNNEVVVLSSEKDNGMKNYKMVQVNLFGNEFCDEWVPPMTTRKGYDRESFQAACRPLMNWLADNCNLHTTVIVNSSGSELLSGEITCGRD